MTESRRQPELAFRHLEVVAITSTVLAFALTALLAGAELAVESNPAAAVLLAELGWTGAGLLAIGVEGALLAGWARLRHRSPRGATAAVGSVAVVGIVDVLRNLWILSRVGWPETIHPRFGVATVAVALAAAVVLTRRRWVPALVLAAAEIRLPSRSTARAVAVSLLVIGVALAGVWPFVGNLGYAANGAAATSVYEDFEDGSFTDSWSGDTGSFSITSTDPLEGTYSLEYTDSVAAGINRDNFIGTSAPDQVTVRFEFSGTLDGTSNQWYYEYYEGSTGTGTGVIQYEINGDDLQVVNSTGTHITVFGDVQPDTSYVLRTFPDYSADALDIEVVEVSGGSVVASMSNVSFKNSGSDIDSVRNTGYDNNFKFDYIASQDAFSADLSGYVYDQSGAAVPNATVKILEYKTSNGDEIARLTKKITSPEPPSFDSTTSFTGTNSVSDVDGTYAIAHTADDWEMSGFQLGGGTAVLQDATLRKPAVTLPAGEPVVLSLWDTDREALLEDTVDEDLPGRTTDGTIVIDRLDAAGNVDWGKKRQTEPIAEVTAIENGGTKTHEGVAIESGLGPGFYRIYPEGHPERAYTLAVAPNGNVNQLASSIREDALNSRDNLVSRAQELQDCIDNGNCAISNTTTNETGYFSLSTSGSSVSEMSLIAYKAPPGMNQDTPTPGEITTYYENQLTDVVETAEDGEITCASVSDVGSYYTEAGMEQVEVPEQNVTLRVRKVGLPDDLDLDKKACLEAELLDELRNSSLADYVPFIRGKLDELSQEEVTRLLAQLRNGALTNEQTCRDTLRSLGVSETSECGLSEGEIDDGWIGPPGEGIPIDNIEEIGRETAEDIIRDGAPNLGGGGGGGTPDVSPGDLENTISGTFPFPQLTLDDEAVVTVRAHLSNGTTKVYNRSSKYVTVEQRSVRPDVVRVEDLPIGDVGGAELAVDVVTPDGTGGISEPITNPDFTGSLPGLRAVRVSAAQPGPDDRIQVGVDGEAGGKFGKLLDVEVIGPGGQLVNTTNVTEDETAFSTNGSGRYKLRLTMTNTDGQEFVEVVGLVAGDQGRARPPTLRGRTGPLGTFAVVSDGLKSGDVETAAAKTQLRVAAIIPSDADVPPSIHVHTQSITTDEDYTTRTRVLRAPDEQAVRKRSTVTHHGASVPSNAIMYRGETQPLPQNGTNEYGRTRYQSNQSVVESYTDAGGGLSIRRITDPGFVDRAFYEIRLRSPSWVPIVTLPSVPPLPNLGDLGAILSALAVLLLGFRGRGGLPTLHTVTPLLVAGALVTAPIVPLQVAPTTADTDLSPADDGLLLSAEELPDDVHRYGTYGHPGWVVRVDTTGSGDAAAALHDWTNASDERWLVEDVDANGYAIVSASRADIGASFAAQIAGRGLATEDYVDAIEPETEQSLPDRDPLAPDDTWSPTLRQRIADFTIPGANFGTEGAAWREDATTTTLEETRQATRSDTLGADGNGTGVTVAVLDTGVNTQSGQVFGNGTAGSDLRIDNASKSFLTGESVNATAGDYDAVEDGNGHGTWAASAIASAADEPYRGYAPDANLLVLKVLGDDGSGSTHTTAEAIRYAAEQDADVIAIGVASPTYSAEVAEAVANATEQGSVVVAPAGDSRATTRWVGSPADTPAEGVLSVGAASVNTDNTTDVASALPAHFSQVGPDPGRDLSGGVTRGEGVDLVAPGVSVEAATPTTSRTRTNRTLSGTSAATAIVAGGLAQALEKQPTWAGEPATVAGYARNTTRVMPSASSAAAGEGHLAIDDLADAAPHNETQADARTDEAEARDEGWQALSDGSAGLFGGPLSTAGGVVGR